MYTSNLRGTWHMSGMEFLSGGCTCKYTARWGGQSTGKKSCMANSALTVILLCELDAKMRWHSSVSPEEISTSILLLAE